MTHGKRSRLCRTCGNLLTKGGEWLKCSRCGYTNKPKSEEEQKRLHHAKLITERVIHDHPIPPTKEEIKARKKAREAAEAKKADRMRGWLARYRQSKKEDKFVEGKGIR